MVRTPLAKLYYSNGSEVLVRGVNICQRGLISFSYTYEEGGIDKASMVFRFNTEVPFSLEMFRPGTYYRIKWGYIGDLSSARRVAVDKFSSSFGPGGYALKVDFVPEIIWKDKGAGHWATIEEAISKLGDIYITYAYDSAETGSHIRIVVTPLGTLTTKHQDEFVLEELDKETKVSPTASGTPFGATMIGFREYSPLIKDWSPREQIENIAGMTKEYADDSVAATYLTGVRQREAGHNITARDNGYTASAADYKATSLFTFALGINTRVRAIKSSRVLSATVTKPSSSDSGKVSGHEAVTVDPLKKQVEVTESKVTETPMAFFNKYGIYSKESSPDTAFVMVDDSTNIFLKVKNTTDPLREFDTIYPDTTEYPGLRFKAAEANAYNKAHEGTGRYSDTKIPARNDDQFLLDFDALQQQDAESYQRALQTFAHSKFKESRITMESLPFITTKTSYPQSKDVVLNMLKGLELGDYFNSLQATIVIEGHPLVSVGFNFNVLGLGDLANGKYHAVKVKHNIQGGRYTMSIEGGKIPHVYSRIVRNGIERAGETFEALENEEYKVPEILDEIFSDSVWKRESQDYQFMRNNLQDINEQMMNEGSGKAFYKASKDNIDVPPTVTYEKIRDLKMFAKEYFSGIKPEPF